MADNSQPHLLQAELDALAVRNGWLDAGHNTWMVAGWRVGVAPEGLPRYLAFRQGDLREFVQIRALENFVEPRTETFAAEALPRRDSKVVDNQPSQLREPRRRLLIVVGGFAALLGLGVISSIFGGADSDLPSSSPVAAERTQRPAETEANPAVPQRESEPDLVTETEPDPVAPEEPVEPELSMGQQQAVGKGEEYLAFTAFSRKGLIEQLVYEGFSQADAAFAVDYIAPDWNEQAAKKAQEYVDMSSFSRQGLIDQLIYEGFTEAQAEYGATAVGY